MRSLICAFLLATLSSPAFALTATSSHADGGVTIRPNVSAGAVLDPGDRITFQYQSARDGVVVLFDIDTQGYVSLLTDEPVTVRARQTGRLPDDGTQLFAEGEPGVDFIFAVGIADPGAIDPAAFASLRGQSRRITGDPFVAANIIAGELVRDISQHTVFIGYTYFYVSERVEYPCYLCGTCDGFAESSECDGYQIVQNFDRGTALAYPLSRGYDMIDVANADANTAFATEDVPMPGNDDVVVNFYPYGSEVQYADPVAVNLWYNWDWYDPLFWYSPYCYPYAYSPWSYSIGWGWGSGWGWGCGWGGYYCSGWYDPGYGCGYYGDYGGYYPSGGYKSVAKYKSQYKSGSTTSSLAANRSYAAKRDGDLRVASKNVRSSPKSVAYGSRTKSATSGYATPGHRVKTSVSGTRSVTRQTWAQGRSGSAYKNGTAYRSSRGSSAYRGRTPSTTKNPGYQRWNDSTRNRSGSTSRVKSTQPNSSNRSWTPSSRGTNRSGGTSPRVGSYKGSSRSSATSHGASRGGSRSSGSSRGKR